MRVPVPHNLPREEVRRRMNAQSHEIAQYFPGGLATVNTSWPSDDRMALDIRAVGQTIVGHIDIEDNRLVIEIDLPPALSFVEPIVANAVRDQGQKLLTAD